MFYVLSFSVFIALGVGYVTLFRGLFASHDPIPGVGQDTSAKTVTVRVGSGEGFV